MREVPVGSLPQQKVYVWTATDGSARCYCFNCDGLLIQQQLLPLQVLQASKKLNVVIVDKPSSCDEEVRVVTPVGVVAVQWESDSDSLTVRFCECFAPDGECDCLDSWEVKNEEAK